MQLPEKLKCADAWEYSEEWSKKIDWELLSKVCKHSGATFHIRYYICDMGEMALTKIKTQNLYINRLETGAVETGSLRKGDFDWQGGHTWTRLNENWEELFELYNARLAPGDILAILKKVKAFMDAGQAHCNMLWQSILDERTAAQQFFEEKREKDRLEMFRLAAERLAKAHERDAARHAKWDSINVKHSNVREGFVYLLSNQLMPGIYKIGFTANNPDTRAKEISDQYRLPVPFQLIQYWRTKDPYIVEQRVHQALAAFAKAGEFFEVAVDVAKEAIESYILRD